MASRANDLAPARPQPLPAAVVAMAGALLAAVGASAAVVGDVAREHTRLLREAADIIASGRLEAIGFAYPPLPVLTAAVFRSPTALAVIGATCGAGALEVGRRSLARRGHHGLTAVVLLASVAAAPPFVALATRTLATSAALFLLVAALDGFRRFTELDETAGGFTAGLLLGVAFFVDFTAIAYLAVAVVAALLSTRARHAADPFERSATVAVLAFPVVAGAMAWGYLEWLFTGTPLHDAVDVLAPIDVSSWMAAGRDLSAIATAFARDVAATPLFLTVAIIRLRRDGRRAVGTLVPLVAIPVAMAFGFPYTPALAFSTLALLALAYVPRESSLSERWILMLAALAQVVVASVLLPAEQGLLAAPLLLLGQG